MRVLHTIHSVDPSHGGTSYGLRGMVEELLRQGIDTEVLVLDEPGSSWLSAWPCKVHAAGRGRGGYGYNRTFDKMLKQLVGSFDQVVVHGLWQYHGNATRRACLRAGVPYAVFPHGMLDRWFSAAYKSKHLLKLVYWRLTEHRLLRDAAVVFFTTEDEFEAGRDTFSPFSVRPFVVPFGIQPPTCSREEYQAGFHQRMRGFDGKRTLLFLGRLHPKKGCDLLVEGFACWHAMLPKESSDEWHLRIVGPSDSSEYLQQLKDIAAAHKLTQRGLVTFTGSVAGLDKWQEIGQADALVLPSHQENFGVIIAESLACGVPVLISSKVNGWRAIQNAGAGFAEEDNVSGVVRLLQRWQELPQEAVSTMRQAAKDYFFSQMSAEIAVQKFIGALEKAGSHAIPYRFSNETELITAAASTTASAK